MGMEGEKQQCVRDTWPAAQACALIRNRTDDRSVRRLVLNLLSHTSQG